MIQGQKRKLGSDAGTGVAPCNLFVEGLSFHLHPPLVVLCQSYNTSAICAFCHSYHLIGFCPHECMSLTRQDHMEHFFSSFIVSCCAKKRSSSMANELLFQDESDNDLWKWIMDCFIAMFPTRVYKTCFHNLAEHSKGKPTSNMAMFIHSMWTSDKIPRPRILPPRIGLAFVNSDSEWCHIGFESVPKK